MTFTRKHRSTIDMPAAIYITTCLVIWLCLLGALILSAKPANAQASPPICSYWPEFKSALADRFQEVPTSTGQITTLFVVQLLVSPGGETWTLVSINRQGVACVLAAGKDWDAVANPMTGEEPT